MRILLLGSGGREHAIAYKIAQSKKVERLFVAPGNAGTTRIATNVNLKVEDFTAIGKFAIDQQIDMVCMSIIKLTI